MFVVSENLIREVQYALSPRKDALLMRSPAPKPLANLHVRLAHGVPRHLSRSGPNLPTLGLLALEVLGDHLSDLRLEVKWAFHLLA